MADSIARVTPAATIANLLFVTGYDGSRRVETLLHDQLFGSGHVVIYRPVRLRAGTLTLAFATAAHAWAAVALLVSPSKYTLTADVSQLSMTFVLCPGDLDPKPGREGGKVWLVDVPFQEVTP